MTGERMNKLQNLVAKEFTKMTKFDLNYIFERTRNYARNHKERFYIGYLIGLNIGLQSIINNVEELSNNDENEG